MNEIYYVFFGVVVSIFSYAVLRDMVSRDEFVKHNYRNATIPALGGLILLLASILSGLILTIIPSSFKVEGVDLYVLTIILGFALIGLLDDLLGDKNKQGFKGHITELLNGRLTTGSLKLFGGPAIVLFALAPNIQGQGYIRVLLDVVCVSLIANLANLLDLAPGRATKYSILALIPLLVFGNLTSFMFVGLGIFIVSLFLDIREKYMLGDTGSNLMGAIVGIAAITHFGTQGTIIVVGFVLFINLLSEFISLSRIIEKTAPLRLFEELGQLKERKTWSLENRKSK